MGGYYSLKRPGWARNGKSGEFSTNDYKLTYLYYLAPYGFIEKTKLAVKFLKRKTKEYEAAKAEIDVLSSLLNCKDQISLNQDKRDRHAD